ncbi:MAG: LLM class flavin-dependent oxidoreductase, partial [Tepidiformaceae bacterium]
SEEGVSFEGKHFRYSHVTIAPRPKQQPLPIWIGGSSDAAIRRTAKYGTGWLGGIQSASQVGPVVTKIKAATAESGRTIDADHYGAGFPYRFGSLDEPIVQRTAEGLARLGGDLDPATYLAVGGADAIAARVNDYIAAGISKFVLRPIAGSDVEMLEQTARLAAEVIPRFAGR